MTRGSPNSGVRAAPGARDSCAVAGCARPYWAGGYCSAHLSRVKQWGDPLADVPIRAMAPKGAHGDVCSVEGCDRAHHTGGYCAAHAARARRVGQPVPEVPVTVREHTPTCDVPGCERPSPTSSKCRQHAYGYEAARENQASAIEAGRHGQMWTGAELEIAARGLPLRELATMLGRSIAAVCQARTRMRNEPKFRALAGVRGVESIPASFRRAPSSALTRERSG